MTRRQQLIPGTQRTEHADIENACAAYCSIRDERSALSKREAQKKAELLALMQVRKVPKYKFHDDNGEEIMIEIEEVETVKVKKTGEAESEIGEGVADGFIGGEPGIHPGLIAQAERAQQDIGVEVNSDGDVVPPTSSIAKKRGKSGPKPKKARARA